MSAGEPLDLLVVGYGINDTGIPRDAAGRGLWVILSEQADLAECTWSTSTKLINGGLRYLQHCFRQVREAVIERARMFVIAPRIVHPLRFDLAYVTGMRPAWMLRHGLFLYDHIPLRNALPATELVRLRKSPTSTPLTTGETTSHPNCGRNFGGFTEAVVDNFVAHETARTAADILWRRIKLGHIAPRHAAEPLAYLASKTGGR